MRITTDRLERVIVVERDDGADLTEEQARQHVEANLDDCWEFESCARISYDKIELVYVA